MPPQQANPDSILTTARTFALITSLYGISFGLMLVLVGSFSGPVPLTMGLIYLSLGVCFALAWYFMSEAKTAVVGSLLILNALLVAIAGSATAYILFSASDIAVLIYHTGLTIWFACFCYVSVICYYRHRGLTPENDSRGHHSH